MREALRFVEIVLEGKLLEAFLEHAFDFLLEIGEWVTLSPLHLNRIDKL